MRRTNPDSLRSYLRFQFFVLNFVSDFFNLLLARSHQAEIIIVKHLIQGRNNETRLGRCSLQMFSCFMINSIYGDVFRKQIL